MKNKLEYITVNFHASIKISKNNMVIYIDPYKITNNLNDADFIFITHSHYDHFSLDDINKVINDKTILIAPLSMKGLINFPNEVLYVKPNENYVANNLSFHTVHAYNKEKQYHTKENNWVGYNILIDNEKYYILGDTDLTLEALKEDCDIIFVPVGGTFTMDYNEAAYLVNNKNIKYAIPIHYGVVGSKEDAFKFIELLKEKDKGIIKV